ncbi:helicase, partial [Cystoisospora suis]
MIVENLTKSEKGGGREQGGEGGEQENRGQSNGTSKGGVKPLRKKVPSWVSSAYRDQQKSEAQFFLKEFEDLYLHRLQRARKLRERLRELNLQENLQPQTCSSFSSSRLSRDDRRTSLDASVKSPISTKRKKFPIAFEEKIKERERYLRLGSHTQQREGATRGEEGIQKTHQIEKTYLPYKDRHLESSEAWKRRRKQGENEERKSSLQEEKSRRHLWHLERRTQEESPSSEEEQEEESFLIDDHFSDKEKEDLSKYTTSFTSDRGVPLSSHAAMTRDPGGDSSYTRNLIASIHPSGDLGNLLQVQNTLKKKTQIIICSRSHSQLAQYMEEIERMKRLSPQNIFLSRLSAVLLAGRNKLCIHPEISSEARREREKGEQGEEEVLYQDLAEGCNLLVEKKKCPLYSNRDLLTDLILTECMNIEDLRTAGDFTSGVCACPYYSAKQAGREADCFRAREIQLLFFSLNPLLSKVCSSLLKVLLVPTTSLLSEHHRLALDIDVGESIVVLDEAHHVPSFIAKTCSALLERQTLEDSICTLRNYLERYRDRVHARVCHSLEQLLRFSLTLYDGLKRMEEQDEEEEMRKKTSLNSSFFSTYQKVEKETYEKKKDEERKENSAKEKGEREDYCFFSSSSSGVYTPCEFLQAMNLIHFTFSDLVTFLRHPLIQPCRKLRGFILSQKEKRKKQLSKAHLSCPRHPSSSRDTSPPSQISLSSTSSPSLHSGVSPDVIKKSLYKSTQKIEENERKKETEENTIRLSQCHASCIYTLRGFLEAFLMAGTEDRLLVRFACHEEEKQEEEEKEKKRKKGEDEKERELEERKENKKMKSAKRKKFSAVQVICLDIG